MASIDLFNISPANGILKETDSRVKLPLVLVYTTILYCVSKWGLGLITVIIITAFISTHPTPSSIIGLKGAWVLSILIFCASWFSSFLILPALIAVDKFILTILLGIILIRTTFPEDIESAVYWYLKPLPFVSPSTVATRFRLTLTFIPELFNITEEINEAREARYIKGEKNPLKRIQTLIFPLLLGIITKAEETSLALESRCYPGEYRISLEKLKIKDVVFLVSNLVLAVLILYI